MRVYILLIKNWNQIIASSMVGLNNSLYITYKELKLQIGGKLEDKDRLFIYYL